MFEPVNFGSPASLSPRRVGIEGPKMSVSRMPVRRPRRENDSARFTASVDLPTPPLALETAIVCETLRILRFWGRPRWSRGRGGGGPFVVRDEGGGERGRPSGFSWLKTLAHVLKHLRIVPKRSSLVRRGDR